MLLVHLFVCFMHVWFCPFSLPLCGIPWTFLLTFLKFFNIQGNGAREAIRNDVSGARMSNVQGVRERCIFLKMLLFL